MKKLLFLLVITASFCYSQEEKLSVFLDFDKLPTGEKITIYYNDEWRPLVKKDSASFYREITFKEKNIPDGKVINYHLNGIRQSYFFANYIGLNKKGIDSLYYNGPKVIFHKNGNKKRTSNYYNSKLFGEFIEYYENGLINIREFYENGLIQGEVFFYYESGEIQNKAVYVDNLLQGEMIGYYESGEISYKVNFIDDLAQGEWIAYYKSGEIQSTKSWIDNLVQGEQIGYYESGEIKYTKNWIDDLVQGEKIGYYKAGELDFDLLSGKRAKGGEVSKRDYYDSGVYRGEKQFSITGSIIFDNVDSQNTKVFYYPSGFKRSITTMKNEEENGLEIGYHDFSGAVMHKVNWTDGKRQSKQIGYYESGEIESTKSWIDNLVQGEEIAYYKSGEIEYTRSWIDNLLQGEQIDYYESGEIEYTKLWLDDKIKERRIALVIGNENYNKGTLENPVNDATLIAESLKKLDFEVLLHTNLATEDAMLGAIKDFGRKRKNYEIGFVYYAGHGVQLNNQNYLLPTKEVFEFEDDVEDNGVSMQRVLRYLESTKENQLNFIVLDACRDNPFESNWNKTRSLKGAGLAKIPPPTGSLIAFSTDHGQTAADGDGGNSLYSQALAEKLLEENVSIEQVFKNVRTEVLRLSGDTQSPVEESKLTGDAFYLNKTNK